MSNEGENMTIKEKQKTTEETTDEQETVLKTQIGNVTYHVGIHFDKNARETLPDKLRHMLRRDVQSGACEDPSTI